MASTGIVLFVYCRLCLLSSDGHLFLKDVSCAQNYQRLSIIHGVTDRSWSLIAVVFQRAYMHCGWLELASQLRTWNVSNRALHDAHSIPQGAGDKFRYILLKSFLNSPHTSLAIYALYVSGDRSAFVGAIWVTTSTDLGNQVPSYFIQ